MSSPPWAEGYVPPIKAVMTAFPYSIEASASIASAAHVMSSNGIRHLPVKEDGEIVGVLSDRDLGPIDLSGTAGNELRARRVGDAMSAPAYTVGLEEPLSEVLATMAERHIGCAIVMHESRLAGIFTTVDACRLFAGQLGGAGPHEDEVA